jgi:hypothetical protein
MPDHPLGCEVFDRCNSKYACRSRAVVKMPKTGDAETGVVRNAEDVKYASVFSDPSTLIRVTIKPLVPSSEFGASGK